MRLFTIIAAAFFVEYNGVAIPNFWYIVFCFAGLLAVIQDIIEITKHLERKNK